MYVNMILESSYELGDRQQSLSHYRLASGRVSLIAETHARVFGCVDKKLAKIKPFLLPFTSINLDTFAHDQDF
ncbi:Protein rhsC [Gossypium arboreum]|uniref:Protein rhsC n=1 Tax=Gossypium arboreum TaxID=29729 RepID=A0A0B0N4F8_GOSAR|nr:Protein rhsC [Gossypium arboreum]